MSDKSSSNSNRPMFAFLLIALLAVCAAYLWSRVLERPDADANVGLPAPDFSLRDRKGNVVSLSALRGRAVLLAFWAVG